jgi:transcriptional regulator with XRE-family HTH domain
MLLYMTRLVIMPSDKDPKNVGPEWARLAKALRARRDELGLTQVEVARLAPVSFSAYTPIETQKAAYLPSTRSLRKIAGALRWTPESCALILAGKKPVEQSAGAIAPSPDVDQPVIGFDAFSADLSMLRARDPEAYATLIYMARKLADPHRISFPPK